MILKGEYRTDPPGSPGRLGRVKCPMWHNAWKSINHCCSCQWKKMEEVHLTPDSVTVRCRSIEDVNQ